MFEEGQAKNYWWIDIEGDLACQMSRLWVEGTNVKGIEAKCHTCQWNVWKGYVREI